MCPESVLHNFDEPRLLVYLHLIQADRERSLRAKQPTKQKISVFIALLKKVVRHPPSFTSLICKKLCTSHVKDLPPVEPHGNVVLAVGLFKMWPYFVFAIIHLREPVLRLFSKGGWNELILGLSYLTCLGVVLSIHPPLLLQL